jgi:thioredoxin reductase (NADPH)
VPIGDPATPVMLVVEDESSARDRIREELKRRYGSDYRVICEGSAKGALAKLDELKKAGEELALLLADQWMPDLTGGELLARSCKVYPHAKRALLIEWAAWAHEPTADAMREAMAFGQMDYYVLKPWRARDEFFHRTITEFLHEWERGASASPQELVLIGERWARRSHELRNLLSRNGVPHRFHPNDSPEGRRLLEEVGHPDERAPVAVLLDGTALVDPSNTELADAYGVATRIDEGVELDVIVVGAGPAGLAAAVYASSEGLRTLVIEGQSIGGQAGSSSRIRNYLGFSRGVSGAELAQRAYQQAWIFGTKFLLMRDVVGLRSEAGRHTVTISDGSEASAPVVILATGVDYRRLEVPELEAHIGRSVFYGASVAEAPALAGKDVFVVGGGNSAGQAAMHLARHARKVTLLVRRGSLAESMSRYLCEEIEHADNAEVRLHTEVAGAAGEEMLESLDLRDTISGEVTTAPASALFILIGARPNTPWLPEEIARDKWGYVLTGPAAGRELMLETSLPGVFAVGDVRDGSAHRVASAVGEGSVVIQQVHRLLAGEGAGTQLGVSS